MPGAITATVGGWTGSVDAGDPVRAEDFILAMEAISLEQVALYEARANYEIGDAESDTKIAILRQLRANLHAEYVAEALPEIEWEQE